jgi:Txe/YoeB family toxin of Txe-Axe toxin-antitoxin module
LKYKEHLKLAQMKVNRIVEDATFKQRRSIYDKNVICEVIKAQNVTSLGLQPYRCHLSPPEVTRVQVQGTWQRRINISC